MCVSPVFAALHLQNGNTEKIAILNELNAPNAPKVQELLEKHGVSKSSLHRWRQPDTLERLQDMVNNGKGSVKRGAGEGVSSGDTTTAATTSAAATTSNAATDNHYRKRDMNDKLRRIKQELQDYCKDNLNKSEDEQLAITSSLITLKAIEFKNDLLKRHRETTPNLLSDEEVVALEAFKGSKSWACQIGNQMGYLSAIGDVKWSDKARENTAAYLERHTGPPKVKKQRMEFTAQEKLAIIMELEDAKKSESRLPMLTVEDVCRKHHTSKSSLHRWKQQYKSGRLQQLAQSNSGYSNVKRVFADKFYILKKALNEFYIENENAPLDKKIVISYTSLQSRAIFERDLILEKHHAAIMASQQQQQQQQGSGKSEEGQPQQQVNDDTDEQMALVILSDDEVNALKSFKASNSWLREAARKFGWKLDVLESNKNTNAVGTMVDSVMAGTAPEVYNHPAASEQLAVSQQQATIDHQVVAPQDQQMEAQQQQALPPGPLPVLDAAGPHHEEVPTNVEQQQLPEHHVDHLEPNMAVYDDNNENNVDAILEDDPLAHVNEVGGATINI